MTELRPSSIRVTPGTTSMLRPSPAEAAATALRPLQPPATPVQSPPTPALSAHPAERGAMALPGRPVSASLATTDPRQRGARRPLHVVVAIGVTATAYALSLASVSSLQFAHDRDLIADRTPVQLSIERLSVHNDSMTDALDDARARYAAAAEGYDALTGRLTELGGLLQRLGGTVADIEGMAGILPKSLNLPTVPKAGSVAKAPPAPAKAAPPPTNAQTGASGAP